MEQDVKARVRAELRWSPEELQLLLTRAEDDADMWGRGVLGEHITMLLLEDPGVEDALAAVVEDSTRPQTARFRALVYLVYRTRDDRKARELMRGTLVASPELRGDRMVCELAALVQEQGWMDVS